MIRRLSYRVLVLEGITERGLEILQAEGWPIDHQKALPPAELAEIVGPYHAILIRSGSQITAEVLDAAKSLKVIGRPGVGVDNVDLQAATRRGVIVMNSPGGNLVSTAELALALILSIARNIPQADASMKSGKWDRKSFAGVELHGKRLGVVGLGRIGREVAARCPRLRDGGRRPSIPSWPPPWRSRCTSGSSPSTSSSRAPTSSPCTRRSPARRATSWAREAFARIKPGVRIVNAARGELIDDEALLAALESGRVAGAALDVHAQEPPVDWRLAKHPRVVATPHVGASTQEAQERVGTDIAVQVRDYLKGGVIQQAVNFFSLSGDLYDQVRPAMDLAERLGLFLGQVCRGSPRADRAGRLRRPPRGGPEAHPVRGRERHPAPACSPRE